MGEKILSVDRFGVGFTMKVTDGKDKVKTWMGTFCTIFALIIVATYAIQKLDILLHKKDVDIISATKEFHFDSNDMFGSE